MSDKDKSTGGDEALFDAAARRTLRLRDGADAAEHAVWLAAGPGRTEAAAEADYILSLIGAATAPEVNTTFQPRRRRGASAVAAPRRRTWKIPAAVAACLVLALGTGVALETLAPADPNRLVAQIGEVRRQVLADGSAVTLNTGAVLDVRYGPEGRRVRLVKGEAFFDVVHDPSRPFVVESRAGSARVLGTAFDVRLAGDKARVSVLRGAVRVEPASGQGAAVLRAGQGAWLDGAAPKALALEDPAAVDAWRRGRLVVYHRPLSEVVDEIGRYKRGKVFVRGQALAARPVSGVFDVARPDAAIDALAVSLDLRTARLGGFVLLY
ncbi:FecR family protein [Caulobacter radicis]|nr:FecR domain-containing protein [Caulobacter radicis]